MGGLEKLTGKFLQGLLVVLILLIFSTESATAQGASLDPNQTEKKIKSRQLQEQRKEKETIPSLRKKGVESSGDRTPFFILRKVTIEGAKVFTKAELAHSYKKFIGRYVSENDLLSIVDAITKHYKQADYTLTRAILPVQSIEEGSIRIKVLEGRIEDIKYLPVQARLHGAKRVMQPVLDETPLRLKTLERQLLLLNDTAGVKVADTSMEETGGLSGRFRLTIHLESWRNYTQLSMDNRGTKDVGPLQSYVSSSFNSAFRDGDVLSSNFSTVPDDYKELVYGSMSYELPVGSHGTRLSGAVSVSELRPGGSRRAVNTVTQTQNYQLKASFVPVRTRATSLWVHPYVRLHDEKESTDSGLTYKDRILSGGVIAALQHHDQWNGSNYLTANLRQGINALGASGEGDQFLSRSDGSGEFTKLYLGATRYQSLKNDFSLRISGAGQLSSRALLSSEEFYIGGTLFGRGYDGGVLSGDDGLASISELRYDWSVDSPFVKHLQLYGFVDGGIIWNETDSGSDSTSLVSAGAGMRINFPRGIFAELEAAQPLTYTSSENPDKELLFFFFVSKSMKVCPEGIRTKCSTK